jgi:hypothetical protein
LVLQTGTKGTPPRRTSTIHVDELLVPVRKQPGLNGVGFSPDYLVPVEQLRLKPYEPGLKALFLLVIKWFNHKFLIELPAAHK